jgi:hypothetical protein
VEEPSVPFFSAPALRFEREAFYRNDTFKLIARAAGLPMRIIGLSLSVAQSSIRENMSRKMRKTDRNPPAVGVILYGGLGQNVQVRE